MESAGTGSEAAEGPSMSDEAREDDACRGAQIFAASFEAERITWSASMENGPSSAKLLRELGTWR